MINFKELGEKIRRDEKRKKEVEEAVKNLSEGRKALCVIAPEARKMFGYNLRCAAWREFADKCREWIDENLENGPVTCISGLNLGAEQVFALIALRMRDEGKDVKVVAAMPFKNQDAKWPDNDLWRYILDHADASFVIEDRPYRECDIHNGQYWIAERCDRALCFPEDPKDSFRTIPPGIVGVMSAIHDKTYVDDWKNMGNTENTEKAKAGMRV